MLFYGTSLPVVATANQLLGLLTTNCGACGKSYQKDGRDSSDLILVYHRSVNALRPPNFRFTTPDVKAPSECEVHTSHQHPTALVRLSRGPSGMPGIHHKCLCLNQS